MRHSLLFLGLAIFLIQPVVSAQAQAPSWTLAVQPINPTLTNDTGARALGVSTDATGNQYIAGVLQTGGGSGVAVTRVFGSTTLNHGQGYGCGFVAKLSPTQQWLWATKATSTGEGITFNQTAVSPAGDVYASGIAGADPLISPNGGNVVAVGSYTYTTTKPDAAFVTRLNANGQPQWLAGISGASVYATQWDVAANNLVVIGTYDGSVQIGATALPPAPYGGVFIARLSSAGQWVSTQGLVPTGTNSTSQLKLYSAAVGPLGQVAINIRLRGGQLALGSSTITSSGSTDRKVVVAQLSPTGQWQWATVAGADNGLYTYNMEYDRSNNLVIMGDAGSSALTLGSYTVPNGEEFTARLSPTGQWTGLGIIQISAGGNNATTLGLALDGRGNAVVGGYVSPNTTYTLGAYTLPSSTTNRNYTARFNFGTMSWDHAQLAPAVSGAGGNASASFEGIALDQAGNLFAAGTYHGSMTFGSTTLTYAAASGSNAFVAKQANAGLVSGVRQAAGTAPLAIWPNPAVGGTAVMLRLPAPAATALWLRVYDGLGRVVGVAPVAAGTQEAGIGTAGLRPGLYMLEIGSRRAQLVVE